LKLVFTHALKLLECNYSTFLLHVVYANDPRVHSLLYHFRLVMRFNMYRSLQWRTPNIF